MLFRKGLGVEAADDDAADDDDNDDDDGDGDDDDDDDDAHQQWGKLTHRHNYSPIQMDIWENMGSGGGRRTSITYGKSGESWD
eukprot:4267531-Pyramimonas_sp.AAC.1